MLQEKHYRWLEADLARNPYVTSQELTVRFRRRFRRLHPHRSTILRAIHHLDFTFKKKTPVAPQRERPDVVEARNAFFGLQKTLDSTRLVFVDEAGCHPGMGPRRGWSMRGKPLFGPEQTYARGRHVSMLGAMTTEGIIALKTLRGGVKAHHFEDFVLKRLVPVLEQDDIVLWDNLNHHKRPDLHEAIESVGATVMMLPKYSPDLNPIEAAWSKVKAWLRKRCPQTVEELRAMMRRALRAVRPCDAQGWFGYAGYTLQYL